MTPERLAELKSLGSIASGEAVPELLAEIERLKRRLRAIAVLAALEGSEAHAHAEPFRQ